MAGALITTGLGVLAVLAVLAVLVMRALQFSSRQEAVEAGALPAVDAAAAAHRLAQALTYRTISYDDGERVDRAPFLALHAYLEATYPRVHATLQREVVGGLSLLYAWPGRVPDRKAVLFVAHLDVVPVDADTEAAWTHPPFGGVVADGYVWGRGALDVKEGLMGQLEAVEGLLAEGFQPARTVYLAYGHDEELSGRHGAAAMAALLAARGVSLLSVFDEGGFTLRGALPGLKAPAAFVGIAEKGMVTLELTAEAPGGHASTPPRRTAIGRLARAVSRLEAHPFPARLGGAARQLLRYAGPEMPFVFRLALANLWLTRLLVKRALARHKETDALIRTTTAATVLEGGFKANVLPSRARALVNFRVLPGQSTADIADRVRRVIADEQVVVRVVPPATEPSPVSPVEALGFRALARALRKVGAADGLLVVPYLMPAVTDSRHYQPLTEGVYRFTCGTHPEDLSGIHGIDERISVAGYASLVQVYCQLLRNLDAS